MSLEVTRQAAGDLFPWGFYALRLGGAGVARAAGYQPSWCASKDIYFFTLVTLTEAPGL